MQLLKNLIIEEVNKKGKITFAGFMQMALYHPKYGYYNSDKRAGWKVWGLLYKPYRPQDFWGTHCKTAGRDVADYGKRDIYHCGDGRQ